MIADLDSRLDRLVGQLLADDAVTPGWAPTFRAVPRHLFVPDIVYRHDRDRSGNDLVPMLRTDDPDAWLDLVYSDKPIITQVDDGHPAADGTGYESTSSTSQPAIVAEMLAALDPRPGNRVLEIGTGTGWNAALLAHAVGAPAVTTIEVDPAVAAHARAALDAAHCAQVTTVVGDGALGHPDGAPYDHIVATVGVRTVPYTWIEQVRPGGRIVVPLTNEYCSPGILVLTRDAEGTASGRLGGPARFMEMRSHRIERSRTSDHTAPYDRESTTDLHPYLVVGDRAAAIAIGMRVPDVSWAWVPDGELGELVMYAAEPRSRAILTLLAEPPHRIRQAGPRSLWDEIVAAYRWWVDAGRPGVRDWLVTVEPHGQRVQLDRMQPLDAAATTAPEHSTYG